MILLISPDGDAITALDVPASIGPELGRHPAPGVVMVVSSTAVTIGVIAGPRPHLRSVNDSDDNRRKDR